MANAKITQLTEDTTPDNDDVTVIVDDLAGTPTTKKATLQKVTDLARSKTSAIAGPPTAVAGDLWLPTDGFVLNRYSGSAFTPWGPIFALTPPVDGDFAWVNQGTASVSTANGGIYLVGPPSATVSVRARVKSAPATPYTITAAFMLANGFSQRVGIGFRESGAGTMSTVEVLNGNMLTVSNWNSATSFNGAPLPGFLCFIPTLVWLRIQDNGTDRIYSVSTDGQNFIVIYTVTRTTFLTADQVLFMVHDTSNVYVPNMTLLSWKET